MIKVSFEQGKKDIAALFGFSEAQEKNGSSFCSKQADDFKIHYTLCSSLDTVKKLEDYFSKYEIENGYVKYNGSALGWANFKIIKNELVNNKR